MAKHMKHWVVTILGAGVVAVLLGACASAPRQRLADAVTLRQQAMSAYRRGDMVHALKNYRALADMLPSDTQVWFHLGNVYARLNQPQLATDAYQHVLQRDPTHAKAWHNMGVVYLHQAEAAFVQSANTATHAPALRKQSMAMAASMGRLARAPQVDDPLPASAASTTAPVSPVAPASSSARPNPDQNGGPDS